MQKTHWLVLQAVLCLFKTSFQASFICDLGIHPTGCNDSLGIKSGYRPFTQTSLVLEIRQLTDAVCIAISRPIKSSAPKHPH